MEDGRSRMTNENLKVVICRLSIDDCATKATAIVSDLCIQSMKATLTRLVAFVLSQAVAFLPQATSVLKNSYLVSMSADDNPQSVSPLLISLKDKLASSPRGDKNDSARLVLASQSPRRRGKLVFRAFFN